MMAVRDVTIGPINGKLSDHYNPKNKTILLSSEVYDKTSIAAASVAAHEVGHALQDKEGYGFLKLRTALVPIVNFTSRTATFIILLGFILEAINLVNLGILFLGIGLLFQLITLPVEFNASARAKRELARCGVVSTEDQTGTSSVLKAAALTYVAVFFATALQILRLIIISRDRN
ncbi:MAG: zinc metallopeptidase [Tenericutes bacterium]|nr:zinc metallopeptidase [Mycoplasmatota bacterium]